MTDEQIINMITVAMVVFGLFVALVIGYVGGYKDGKKQKEKDK